MKTDFIHHVRGYDYATVLNWKYKIKKDGSVDVLSGNVNVDGNVMDGPKLTRLPIKFGVIHDGYFDVSNNHLTSLENFPDEVKSSVFKSSVWVEGNKKQFTDKEVRKVCKVGGGHDIHV
jgi:hypothetical protein